MLDSAGNIVKWYRTNTDIKDRMLSGNAAAPFGVELARHRDA